MYFDVCRLCMKAHAQLGLKALTAVANAGAEIGFIKFFLRPCS